MPQLGVVAIVELLSAAAAATEAGLQIAGTGKPSAGDARKQLEAAKEAQATADAEAKRKAIFASLSSAQEQTGGSLNAPSLVDLASVIAGMPGEAGGSAGKKALSDYLGTPSSSSSGETMVSSTYGLSGSQG